MSNFTFSKSISNRSYFWFWQPRINISPKCFYSNFDLSYSKHRILDCISFTWRNIYFKILDISSKVKLCMKPITMSDSIYIFIKFWVFIRFQIYSWFENISFSFFYFTFSIKNIWFCCIIKTKFHQSSFNYILDMFNSWNTFIFFFTFFF